MTDDDSTKPAEKKESLGRFLLRFTQPFDLDTSGLGRVQVRRMTVKAFQLLVERLPSVEGVSDFDLVRTYMGCVAGIPGADPEAIPEPLTVEQVECLAVDDVRDFAQGYLEHYVKPEQITDPIAQAAESIRAERDKAISDAKQMAETLRSALKVHATADIMKHWQELSRSVAGPIESLQERIAEMLGPRGQLQSSVTDALRGLEKERERATDALRIFETERERAEEAARNVIGEGALSQFSKHLDSLTRGPFHVEPAPFQPPLMPDLPDVGEMPAGRTANAVEELNEAGRRMEAAMGVVVKQAGNISDQIGAVVTQIEKGAAAGQDAARQLLTKIEHAAAAGQESARKVLRVSVIALVISGLALLLTVWTSWQAYRDGVHLAEAQAQAAMDEEKRFEEQVAILRALLAESRKPAAAPTEVPATVPAAPAVPSGTQDSAGNDPAGAERQ